MIKKLIFILFLLTGYFAPLAFASVDIWSQTVIHLCSIGIAVLFLLSYWGDNTFVVDIPFWKYLSLWLAVYYISYLFSANRSLAQAELFNLINGVFFFYCAVNIKRWCFSLDRLLRLWGYIVIPLALLSFYELWRNPGSYQESASMINPNIFAGYLVFWIPYWAGKVRDNWGKNNVPAFILSCGTFICAVGSLIITHSVTAWVALIISVSVIYYANMKDMFARLFHIKISFLRIVTVLLILLAVLFLNKNIILSIFERVCWASVSLWMALKHPFLGVGPGGFAEAFLYFKKGSFQNTLYAHNMLFQMVGEIGIIGTVIFILLLYKILLVGLKDKSSLSRILLVGLLSFILKNMWDYGFSIPANAFMLWFWSGLLVSLHIKQTPLKISIISKSALIINIVIIVLLVPCVIKPFMISREVATGYFDVQERNYQKAISHFNKAIFRGPLFPEAYFGLSQVYYTQYLERRRIIYIELSIIYTEKAILYSKYNKKYRKFLEFLKNIDKTLPGSQSPQFSP